VNKETLAKVNEDIQKFYNDVDQVADKSAEHQLTGFAKIKAEADKQIADLERGFAVAFPNPNDKDYAMSRSALDVGEGKIRTSQRSDEAQLAQKNAVETQQIVEEAQKRSMSVEKQQTLAIEAEYQERKQKYDQQLQSQEIGLNDFNARQLAALKIKDAEMQAEAKSAADKLAGTLEGFFKDPGGEAVKLAEQMMWRITSAWLLQLSTYNKQAHTLLMEGPDSFIQFAMPKSMRPGHGSLPGSTGTAGATGVAGSAVAGGTAIALGALSAGIVGNGQTGNGSSGSFRPSYNGGASGGSSSGESAESVTGPILSGAAIATRGVAGINGARNNATGSIPALGSGIVGSGASLGSDSPSMDTLGTRGSTAAPVQSNTSQKVLGDIGGTLSLGKQLTGDFAGSGGGGADAGSAALPSNGNSLDISLGGGGQDTAGLGDMPSSNALAGGGSGNVGDGDPAAGNTSTPDAASGSSKLLGEAGAAFSAGVGLWGAHESNGGFGGALGGAASGAELGMMVGGPMGAAIGAGAGAIIGFFGVGGTAKAKKYDKETVRPAIAQERAAFEGGQTDYLTAYGDLESLDNAAKKATNQMGSGGQHYYQDTIKKEILGLESTMTRMSKAGRGRLSFTAAQYHGGGDIDNFGDLATSPTEGLIHAELGEFMVKPSAAAQNRSTLRQMQAGASIDSMVDSYRSTMQTNSAQQAQRQGDVTANLHFHSFDAKGARDMLMNNAPAVRAALNASQSSYGGKSDA
jgi:hypothetical protein